jgi:hypothetical protein
MIGFLCFLPISNRYYIVVLLLAAAAEESHVSRAERYTNFNCHEGLFVWQKNLEFFM